MQQNNVLDVEDRNILVKVCNEDQVWRVLTKFGFFLLVLRCVRSQERRDVERLWSQRMQEGELDAVRKGHNVVK